MLKYTNQKDNDIFPKDAVQSMCRKYIKHFDSAATCTNIEDESDTKKALEEIMRQKSFLER